MNRNNTYPLNKEQFYILDVGLVKLYSSCLLRKSGKPRVDPSSCLLGKSGKQTLKGEMTRSPSVMDLKTQVGSCWFSTSRDSHEKDGLFP